MAKEQVWKFSSSATKKELDAMLAGGLLTVTMTPKMVYDMSEVIRNDITDYKKFSGNYQNWRKAALASMEKQRTGGKSPPTGMWK